MQTSREGLKLGGTFLLGALAACVAFALMPLTLRQGGYVYTDELISIEVSDPSELREDLRSALELIGADVSEEEPLPVIYTLRTSDEITPTRPLSIDLLLTVQPDGTLADASLIFGDEAHRQFAGLTAPRILDIPTTTGPWHAWDKDADWRYESLLGPGPVIDGRTQQLFFVEGMWRPGFLVRGTEVEVDGQRHVLRGGYWLPE